MRPLLALAIIAMLTACGRAQSEPQPVFHNTAPNTLSEWGMLQIDDGTLRIANSVTAYDLATPLFSDYALKLRTIWIANDGVASFSENGALSFPDGTVVTKTFFYRKPASAWQNDVVEHASTTITTEIDLSDFQLIETRLLIKQAGSWEALSYVWDGAQTNAVLKRTGELKRLTLSRKNGEREDFVYAVPNINQCASCHGAGNAQQIIAPIGLKQRHLNKTSGLAPAFNQLDHWIARGLVATPRNEMARKANADWQDMTMPLAARARAYLDINCSHCHNPHGAADTSGLDLEPDASGPALGVCKQPIAAGSGSGGLPFDITPGSPGDSITIFRMQTNDPGAMMPELGRAVEHIDGTALIAEWITAMEGTCT